MTVFSSFKKFKSFIGIITLIFFLLQILLPLDALASKNRGSASDFWKALPTLPSWPKGFQNHLGSKNPPFYFHHFPDPVNALNGNLFLAYQDFYITARGFPLELSRSYNSRGTTKGLFGYGWSSSLETNLEELSNGSIRIKYWDGATRIYYPDTKSEKSSKEKRFVSSSVSIQYIVKKADGTLSRIFGDCRKETYSRQGKIMKKEDAYGNGLIYSYDPHGLQLLTIADTSGRKIQITYIMGGLIQTVTNPLGKKLVYSYDANSNLVSVTGLAGEATRFSYDSDHNLTTMTMPDGAKITNVYDRAKDLILQQEGPGGKKTVYQYQFSGGPSNAQQTFVFDAKGNKTTYTYQFFNEGPIKKLTVEDPMGGKTIEEYDRNENLILKVDPNENSTTYQYNAYGLVKSITDSMGGFWNFEYAENCDCKQVTSIKDPLNNITAFQYNDKFAVSETINPSGHSIKFKYDAKGDLIESMTSEGARIQYRYDPYGYLISWTDPGGITYKFVYDIVGKMTDLFMPGQHRSQYRYDAKGRLIETINPMGYSIKIAYDPMDRIVKVADDESDFINEYNEAGLIIGSRDPEGNMIRFEYDSLGNMIKIIDAAKKEWRFSYDKLSRVTDVINPMNQKARFVYDLIGNLTEVIDPLNARTTFSYDRSNRLIKITDPLGNSALLNRDPLGRIVSIKDAEGHTNDYLYDAAGGLISAMNAMGHKTALHYDNNGNIKRHVDASGSETEFYYDNSRRVIKRVDALKNITSYSYDNASQIVKVIPPNNSEMKYIYNSLNLVERIVPKNGPPLSFTYNKKGQLIAKSEGEFSHRYKYNKTGLLTEAEDVLRKRKILYSYDSRSNLLKAEILPDGIKTIYEYDNASQLTRINTGAGEDYHFSYDAAGRRVSLTFPNNVTTFYSYDKAGRLKEIKTVDKNGNLISRDIYAHNKAGMIISKTDKDNLITQYKYDPADRLVEASYPNHFKETFVYDSMGNILKYITPEMSREYSYNKGNQLTKAGDTALQYDKNGNLIRMSSPDKAVDYKYDDLNRMNKIVFSNGDSVSYKYGASFQKDSFEVSGETVHTVFDKDLPVMKLDKTMNTLSRTVFGPGYFEPLSQMGKDKKHFFHANHIGNITAVTDHQGKVISNGEYRAFGSPINMKGEMPPYAFTGLPYSSKTGLVEFKYRDYDPSIFRFLQEEPLAILFGCQNTYVYASNNPVNMIDIYGLWTFFEAVGAATLGLIAVAVVAAIAAPAAATALAIAAGSAVGITTTTTAITAGSVALGGAVVGGILTAQTTKAKSPFLATVGGAAVGAVAGLAGFVGGTFAAAGGVTATNAAFIGGGVSGFLNSTAKEIDKKTQGGNINLINIAAGTGFGTLSGGFGGNVFKGGTEVTAFQGFTYGFATKAWSSAGTGFGELFLPGWGDCK